VAKKGPPEPPPRRAPIPNAGTWALVALAGAAGAWLHRGVLEREGGVLPLLGLVVLLTLGSLALARLTRRTRNDAPVGAVVVWLLLACGVLGHAVLATALVMFLSGIISESVLIVSQIANGGLLLVLTWSAERWRGGAWVRSMRDRAAM